MLLARQMLRDPYWPMHAAQELGVTPRGPRSIHARRPKDRQNDSQRLGSQSRNPPTPSELPSRSR